MSRKSKTINFIETNNGRLYYCSTCKKYLPKENFCTVRKNTNRDCTSVRCRECSKKSNLKVREKLINEDALNYMLKNKLGRAKCRAKQTKIPFNITFEDLYSLWKEQNGRCAISNIPMTYTLCNGNVMTNISLDQINPKAGYTKNNIQLVCWAVNRMKGEMDMNSLLHFVNAINYNYV